MDKGCTYFAMLKLFTKLGAWFNKLVPLSHLIYSQTKTNHNLLAYNCPALCAIYMYLRSGLFISSVIGQSDNFGPPGGGGVLPYENDRGACRKFSKTPLKGSRISFCGHGFEFMYTPKRYQFLNNKLVVNNMTIFKQKINT